MMVLEFNPDGTPKGSEKNIQSRPLIDFDRTIVLNFSKENWGDSIDCKFIINIPNKISEDELKELEGWVDDKVKTKDFSTSIGLEKINPHKFELLINGIGHDNRCRWCKSFRTALKTFCNKKRLNFQQMSFCKFEDGY